MNTTTEFQLVDIDKLVPYANNARTHNKEQILKLRSSLREFGFVNPVIIDREYNVLAGHGRIEAAKAGTGKHRCFHGGTGENPVCNAPKVPHVTALFALCGLSEHLPRNCPKSRPAPHSSPVWGWS